MKEFHFEQVLPANTFEEMRAEIHRLRGFDTLVGSTMDLADFSGASVEDRYTALAYFALKERNAALEKMLNVAMYTPHLFIYRQDTTDVGDAS